MNEFEARDYILAKKITDITDAQALLAEVFTDFNYEYGVAPRSLAALLVRIANFMCYEWGLTGFQAGFVMWDFVRGFYYTDNKCGLRMVDYDNMLYPQYEYKFQKTIRQQEWRKLQEEAQRNLDSKGFAADRVTAHWQSIVDGVVPFGYEVDDE